MLKKKGKKYELALKLDMNKAYDKVEWDFFWEEVLMRMGFAMKWIHWIMECVRVVSYSLVINEKPTFRFCPTKDLR